MHGLGAEVVARAATSALNPMSQANGASVGRAL
jgi:hypothetical protein